MAKMKARMRPELEVKKNEIINSAVGSEEEGSNNDDAEVYIPAPKKEEGPKSQNEKDMVLTSSPREQVHHTDQIVLEISHLFQIHET